MAAPATVRGEPFAESHWTTGSGKAATGRRPAKPGDLPGIGVAVGCIGRGVSMLWLMTGKVGPIRRNGFVPVPS